MRRLTELLSSPVISLYNSKTEGTVKNVIFDKNLKKLKWLVMFNDKDLNEEKFLPVSSIYTIGENAIIIKNNEDITPTLNHITETSPNNPINNKIYSTSGKLLGKVVEVELDEKNNLINIVLDNHKKLSRKEIARSGEDALIIQDPKNPVKIGTMKKKAFPKVTKISATQTVKALEVNSKVKKEKVSEKEITTNANSENISEKVITNKTTKPENTKVIIEEKVKSITPNADTNPKAETVDIEKKELATNKELAEVTKAIKNLNSDLINQKAQLAKQVESLKDSTSNPKTKTEPLPEPTTTLETKTPKKELDTKEIKANNKKIKLTKKEKNKKKDNMKTISPQKSVKVRKYLFDKKTSVPSKILTNNKFLIDRTVTKSIHTNTKEVIVKSGAKINKTIINKAMLNGKLKELINFSQ